MTVLYKQRGAYFIVCLSLGYILLRLLHTSIAACFFEKKSERKLKNTPAPLRLVLLFVPISLHSFMLLLFWFHRRRRVIKIETFFCEWMGCFYDDTRAKIRPHESFDYDECAYRCQVTFCLFAEGKNCFVVGLKISFSLFLSLSILHLFSNPISLAPPDIYITWQRRGRRRRKFL